MAWRSSSTSLTGIQPLMTNAYSVRPNFGIAVDLLDLVDEHVTDRRQLQVPGFDISSSSMRNLLELGGQVSFALLDLS
jgi:hypothetical protein